MRRNNHRKLSASIFHHAKKCGNYRNYTYPKNKVVILLKDLKIIKNHAILKKVCMEQKGEVERDIEKE